jgi:hypothetical protein
VPSVASRKSVSSGSECGKILFPFQKMTSQTRNCFVRRSCFGLMKVYSLLRRREWKAVVARFPTARRLGSFELSPARRNS